MKEGNNRGGILKVERGERWALFLLLCALDFRVRFHLKKGA